MARTAVGADEPPERRKATKVARRLQYDVAGSALDSLRAEAAGPTPLVLAGAGGLARETAEAVRAVNAAADPSSPVFDLLGFLDDDPAKEGTTVLGLPVLGPLALARTLNASVVVCVANPADPPRRRRVVETLDLPVGRYATVVHPTAVVPGSCVVGAGSVLLAHTVLTADVTIGAHVSVMPHTVFTHDDQVADFATFGAGVRLAGGVRVGEAAYLGSGALVREYRTIGAGAMVGMGSVVLDDIPPGELWAGVPARFRRMLPAPKPPRDPGDT